MTAETVPETVPTNTVGGTEVVPGVNGGNPVTRVLEAKFRYLAPDAGGTEVPPDAIHEGWGVIYATDKGGFAIIFDKGDGTGPQRKSIPAAMLKMLGGRLMGMFGG